MFTKQMKSIQQLFTVFTSSSWHLIWT